MLVGVTEVGVGKGAYDEETAGKEQPGPQQPGRLEAIGWIPEVCAEREDVLGMHGCGLCGARTGVVFPWNAGVKQIRRGTRRDFLFDTRRRKIQAQMITTFGVPLALDGADADTANGESGVAHQQTFTCPCEAHCSNSSEAAARYIEIWVQARSMELAGCI